MAYSVFQATTQDGGEAKYREELVRLAFEAADVGLWDFDPVSGKRYWSASVKASFGLPPDAEVTSAVFEQGIHPDDRHEVTDALRRAMDPAVRAAYALEYRTVGATDGEVRWVAAKGRGLFDSCGVCVRVLGTAVDVTSRKLDEALHQETTARLALLDRIGLETRAITDPSEVMGVTAKLLGEHLKATRCAYADVEMDSDRFTIRNDWARTGVASSAGSYSLDLFGPQATSNLRNGKHLVVNDVDRELGDEGGGRMFNSIGIKAIVCAGLVKEGRLVAMMAVHQDTPRVWAEHELSIIGEVVDRCWAHIERIRSAILLQDQDRRKDEFLATLAHELRNPLAPLMYSTVLLKRSATPSREARAIEIIERQSSHLARLIDDLLDVSRINRGLIELKREVLPFTPLLEQAVEASMPALEAARHTVTLRSPDSTAYVNADPARLVQVLTNLLNNAAKYTPDGGQISVVVTIEGETLAIEVGDNGVGIPKEEQGRLFQMFSQLPHTGGRTQGGLGIGLALARRLVEMHEGTVRAESDGLGKGSVFRVTLPLASEIEPSEPQTSLTLAGRRRAEVLVVEDNTDGREALLELLRSDGHVVTSAGTGLDALAKVEHHVPDIVLLDLGLPLMDGIEVAERLRADSRFANTKLVALTGWGTKNDRARTAAAGFNAHLTKPVEPETLLQLISEWTTAPAKPS